METSSRQHRCLTPHGLERLLRSSEESPCTYRRLNFESLEERVYLAADLMSLVGYPVAGMKYISDEIVAPMEPVETMVREIRTFVPTPPRPYLKDIGDFEFDDSVETFEIPLIAENVGDESIVFVIEMPSSGAENFEAEMNRLDANRAQLIVRRTQDFVGTFLIRVKILKENQADSELYLDTKEVWVHINDLDAGPAVDLSLTATTPSGAPITNLRPGDDFILHVWTQDLRANPKGIFAAYLNINWNSELAITTGDIQHGERFFNGQAGDLSQGGLIGEAGGFGGMAQSDGKRYELFSVPMRATSAGELALVSSHPTIVPAHNVLVHGLDGGIGPSLIQFGKLQLTIADSSPTDDPVSSDPGTAGPSDPIAISDPPAPALNPPPPLELPTHASADTIAGFSITVTAPDGTPLQNPRVGDDFVVHLWVKDARQIPLGVMAAFLNVTWDANRAAPTGPLSYGERFANPHPVSTIRPGMVEQAGGMEVFGHNQGEWLEVFSIPLRATADGELTLFTTPSTPSKLYDILFQGLDGGLDPHAVYFGIFSLTIGAGEPSTGTEQPPTLNDPSITNVPTIVAIPDDSKGNRFAVNILELLSPAMQAEFANGSAANNLSGKDNDSRALLLSLANPDNVADPSPLPTTDHETDLAVVSRKPNPDSTADTLDDQAITAKTDLSLI